MVFFWLKSRARPALSDSDLKSVSDDTLAASDRRCAVPQGRSSVPASATRRSRKLGSSGDLPAGVVYRLSPEGDVKVCAVGCGAAPLGDAPVSASSVSFRPTVRSLPSVRRALITGSTARTRPPPSW
jgi:hypothetical protein